MPGIDKARDPPAPDSPASTASTASILANEEVVPARKKLRASSITSTASTASLNVEESSKLTTDPGEGKSTVDEDELKGEPLVVLQSQRFRSPHKRHNGFQLDESPEQFVQRLPPSITSSNEVGDWIWVHNPYFDSSTLQRPRIDDFILAGRAELRSFDTYTEDIEMGEYSARVKQAKITQQRKALPSKIKDMAQQFHVTHGKWMLFPPEMDVDEIWLKIVKGCAEGKLGTGAKVAPAGSMPQPSRLICIYTKDYSDMDDVKRVLLELQRYGLLSEEGRSIYYKADAWTYLGIDSKNGYGLRASLYSSAEVLKDHVVEQPKSVTKVQSKLAIGDSNAKRPKPDVPAATKPAVKTGRNLPW